MPRVRQILFVAPGPIVWARHRGTFEEQGLEVETTQTLSSDQIGRGLADGTWDVGIGVVDNVLAWNAELEAGLQIFAQLERSQVMAFCAKAGCNSLPEAAKGAIAVDATTNGFVLVLYRALVRAGIDPATCRFDRVGGVRQRFEALGSGQADATILVPPFIDLALARGCTKLWDGHDLAPEYPGVVVAARRSWIDDNVATARSYLRALTLANAWAMAAENRDEAEAALAESGYAAAAAARLVRDAVPGLTPSRAGFMESVALRRESGMLHAPAPAFDAIVRTDLQGPDA
jgi:ABC-type nitrate/sulfonate/bicarbonate transport system substrate-binding protein